MKAWFALVTTLVVLTGCGGGSSVSSSTSAAGSPSASQIHVFSASVTPGGDEADVSLALHNGETSTDRLTGVSCACATGGEIHGANASGDIGPVDSVRLPPDKVVIFAPGGPHIVLIGLHEPLTPGMAVTLELSFATSAPVSVVAPVKAAPTPSAA
jgi:copper(I)-binding protein